MMIDKKVVNTCLPNTKPVTTYRFYVLSTTNTTYKVQIRIPDKKKHRNSCRNRTGAICGMSKTDLHFKQYHR